MPESSAIFDIHSISARVLRNNEKFLNSRANKVFRFLHDFADGPADQVSAQLRDDAESAAMIAAFRNFQIRVVFGSESCGGTRLKNGSSGGGK